MLDRGLSKRPEGRHNGLSDSLQLAWVENARYCIPSPGRYAPIRRRTPGPFRGRFAAGGRGGIQFSPFAGSGRKLLYVKIALDAAAWLGGAGMVHGL